MSVGDRLSPQSFHTERLPWYLPESTAPHRYGASLAASISLLLLSFLLAQHPAVFDMPVAKFIRSFVRHDWIVDAIFGDLDQLFSFSGVFVMALLWGEWVGKTGSDSRLKIVMSLAGAFFAGIISRSLQHLLSTHIRPFHNSELNYPQSFSMGHNTWNSFPSDHVSVYAALAASLWIVGHRYRVPVIIWLAFVESSRMFEGAHYLSDLIGGAALGVTMVMAFQIRLLSSFGKKTIEQENRSKSLFYILAFFLSYQMSTLFNDVRATAGSFKPPATVEKAG